MKSILSLAMLLFINLNGNLGSTITHSELSVVFHNVNAENKGKIYIAMYNQKKHFMTQNFYKSTRVDVEKEKFVVHFKDIPFGTYAISAFHDLNDNQQLDFNENGMPVEDYAMSGTPEQMGPPTWEAVKFQFSKNNQTINVYF